MNALKALRGTRPTQLPLKAWSGLTSWLTSRRHATIGFSFLRIIFGIAMLIVLIPSFADRHYLWGAGSWWIEPEARRRGWSDILRGVFSKQDPVLFDVAYLVLLLLVVLFIVGLKTRWVTPFLLLFWVGLSTNSTLLTNGGDTLMRIVLFFAIFASLSEHLSVDSLLRKRAAARGRIQRSLRPRFIPEWFGTWLHNTALILCCYQILLVYLVSSILKLQGEEWIDGTALYYALVLNEFQVLPTLSEFTYQWAWVVNIGTWMALTVQLLFPLALLWKPSRYLFVALITFTHLGIAVLLGLWPFSLAMIAVDLLLIRDGSWLRLGAFIRERAGRLIERMPDVSSSASRTAPAAGLPTPAAARRNPALAMAADVRGAESRGA